MGVVRVMDSSGKSLDAKLRCGLLVSDRHCPRAARRSCRRPWGWQGRGPRSAGRRPHSPGSCRTSRPCARGRGTVPTGEGARAGFVLQGRGACSPGRGG